MLITVLTRRANSLRWRSPGQKSVPAWDGMSGQKVGSVSLLRIDEMLFEYCENRGPGAVILWDETKTAWEPFPCAMRVVCLCFVSVFGLDEKEQEAMSSLLVSVVWLQTSSLRENSGWRHSLNHSCLHEGFWCVFLAAPPTQNATQRLRLWDFGTRHACVNTAWPTEVSKCNKFTSGAQDSSAATHRRRGWIAACCSLTDGTSEAPLFGADWAPLYRDLLRKLLITKWAFKINKRADAWQTPEQRR